MLTMTRETAPTTACLDRATVEALRQAAKRDDDYTLVVCFPRVGVQRPIRFRPREVRAMTGYVSPQSRGW